MAFMDMMQDIPLLGLLLRNDRDPAEISAMLRDRLAGQPAASIPSAFPPPRTTAAPPAVAAVEQPIGTDAEFEALLNTWPAGGGRGSHAMPVMPSAFPPPRTTVAPGPVPAFVPPQHDADVQDALRQRFPQRPQSEVAQGVPIGARGYGMGIKQPNVIAEILANPLAAKQARMPETQLDARGRPMIMPLNTGTFAKRPVDDRNFQQVAADAYAALDPSARAAVDRMRATARGQAQAAKGALVEEMGEAAQDARHETAIAGKADPAYWGDLVKGRIGKQMPGGRAATDVPAEQLPAWARSNDPAELSRRLIKENEAAAFDNAQRRQAARLSGRLADGKPVNEVAAARLGIAVPEGKRAIANSKQDKMAHRNDLATIHRYQKAIDAGMTPQQAFAFARVQGSDEFDVNPAKAKFKQAGELAKEKNATALEQSRIHAEAAKGRQDPTPSDQIDESISIFDRFGVPREGTESHVEGHVLSNWDNKYANDPRAASWLYSRLDKTPNAIAQPSRWAWWGASRDLQESLLKEAVAETKKRHPEYPDSLVRGYLASKGWVVQ